MDILVLKAILGHASLLTTVQYTHLTHTSTLHSERCINQLMNQFDINWGEYPMIRLASIINQFEGDFLKTYQGKILPSQLRALQALKHCRSENSPMMRVSCTDCDHQVLVPHSCGH